MRFLTFAAILATIAAIPAFASVDPAAASLNGKDVQQLAERIIKSLRKCKQLRGHPNVVVSVENNTDEFFDKTHFAELLHGLIEGKTHSKPETTAPDFDIQVQIGAEKQMVHRVYSAFYKVKTTVSQSEERLCTKEVKYTKRTVLRQGQEL